MTTITTDYEHNCETWWAAARESSPPPACTGLIDQVDTITVPDDDAHGFLAWAARLPGWSESPFVVSR